MSISNHWLLVGQTDALYCGVKILFIKRFLLKKLFLPDYLFPLVSSYLHKCIVLQRMSLFLLLLNLSETHVNWFSRHTESFLLDDDWIDKNMIYFDVTEFILLSFDHTTHAFKLCISVNMLHPSIMVLWLVLNLFLVYIGQLFIYFFCVFRHQWYRETCFLNFLMLMLVLIRLMMKIPKKLRSVFSSFFPYIITRLIKFFFDWVLLNYW